MKRLNEIVILGMMLVTIGAPLTTSSASNRSLVGTSGNKPKALSRAAVQVFEGGRIKCREATPEESLRVMRRQSNVGLHELNSRERHTVSSLTDGLKITIRGTSQLERFPAAKAIFRKAVSEWESIIRNPIEVVVDVDFGPTHFGEPFDPDNLGLTSYQMIWDDDYPAIRSKLLAGASTAEIESLYGLLPTNYVPTDLGNMTSVFGPSPVFRALGTISPVADPEGEMEEFGPPPTIAFNSAFDYDFDPSDGIDADKMNLLSVAEHEIGHLLGFFSMTGNQELFPEDPLGVSVWDLCRFRPGIRLENFGPAQRILSSGGEHVFFAGRGEVQLSTGRTDQTGGDHQQPSHWKADELSYRYIGVMDPTLDYGELNPITHDDLDALEAMGYRIARDVEGTPAILDVAASLDGDTLFLSGTAADRNGDIVQAQVSILDGDGLIIADTGTIPVDMVGSSQVSFWLDITNLSVFPTAVQARLILIDRDGNASAPVIVGFNEGDAGGPVLSAVTFSAKKLKLVGEDLDGGIALEINGLIVAEGDNETARKLVVKGRASSLNMQTGPNRVRVRRGGLWSNIHIFDLQN